MGAICIELLPLYRCTMSILRYTPYTPTTSRYTRIYKGVRGVIGSDITFIVGATLKFFDALFRPYLVYAKKGATCKCKPLPTKI